jgi:hypothetical protein
MNSTFYTKICLLVALLLSRVIIINAQVTNYTFSQSTVNDNFVNGITLPWVTMPQSAAHIGYDSNILSNPLKVIYTGNSSTGSTAEFDSGPGYPIGFNFIYNGESFDRVALSGNGYIKLGHSNQSITLQNDSIAGAIFDGSSYHQDVIAAFQTNASIFNTAVIGQVGTGSAGIRIQTMGLPGNRIFVVQYNYIIFLNGGANLLYLPFQIALFENGNNIQITYQTFDYYGGTLSTQGAVGITDDKGDYNSRKITNGTNTWPTSAAGTSTNDLCDLTDLFGPQGSYTQNLVYTWTPPTPAPTAPTCPEAYISTEYIEAGGAVESTAPDGSYYKDLNNATNVPTNSSTLSWSDVSLTSNQPTTYDMYLDISNPPLIQVAQNLAATSYTPSILAPNTTYYYNIVPINASGRDSACVGSFTTDSTLQYCIVYYGNGRINSFAVNTLSFVATNSNNNEKLPAVSPYITTLKRDTTYNCTITLNSEEANTYPYCNTTDVAVWIDFNQDGNFNDPGDAVGSGSAGLNGTITFPISIPDTAKLGTTTMRLAYKGDNYESLAPCTNSYFLGGDEDFTVTIAPSTSCQSFGYQSSDN